MKKIWTSVWNFVKKYKKTVIVAIIIIVGGFWYYHSTHIVQATTYTVRPATLGTIQTTVSGTGQVSSSQELAVAPQVSGTVVSINVKDGQAVTQGQVLATLDSTNAYYSLENAKIAVQKLETSDPISIAGDQNSLTSEQDSLDQAYQSAFSSVTSSYDDLGTIVTGLNSLFYGKNASPYFGDTAVGVYGSTATSYKQTAGLSVDKATQEYNAFQAQELATSVSSTTSITNSLSQELTIAQDINTAVKNTSLAINYVIDQTPQSNRNSTMTTDQNNVSSWLSTASQDSSSLASDQDSIQNDEQSISQDQSNLNADQTTNDPLALQSAQLALQEAQTTYDEYSITAPFSGVIGNVTLQVGDQAGPSTPIGTIVTKQYQSTIVLNEVNVAKVAVGQPVNITFNALPNVTATGTVTDVDTVGTVSSGVVSYNVIVSYNSDNPEIKAGMSINASIITAEADNVLVVPNSAIKTLSNGTSYVQIPASPVSTSSNSNTATASSGFARRGGGFGSSTRAFNGGYASSTASGTAAYSGYGYGSASSTGSTTAPRNFSNYSGAGTGATAAPAGGTVTTVTNKIVQIGLSDNTDTQIVSGLNPGDLVVTQTTTGTAAKTTTSANLLSSLGGARTGAAGGAGGFAGGGRGG